MNYIITTKHLVEGVLQVASGLGPALKKRFGWILKKHTGRDFTYRVYTSFTAHNYFRKASENTSTISCQETHQQLQIGSDRSHLCVICVPRSA